MTYIHPLFPLLLLLTLVAALEHWLRPKQNRSWLLLLPALCLFLVSWPPVAWLASATLERRYHVASLPEGEAEAIVVLAGDVDSPRWERPDPIVKYDTYVRCRHAAWLYQNWRAVPVLACAGAVPDFSVAMQDVLESAGVPRERIWLEGTSRNTYENAVYAAEILRLKGVRKVALVTEAHHMLRAEKCFRKQGLDVQPAPCNFRYTRWGVDLKSLLPRPSAIAENEDALHEWLGLLWYWARDRV